MTGVVEARAALERGRSVIVVAPPAVEHAAVVWELITGAAPPAERPGAGRRGPETVILCTDPAGAVEWADAAPLTHRVHPVTGLARSERLLLADPPPVLAGAAKDLAALVARSALKFDDVSLVVVAWPEDPPEGYAEAADALLAEGREARRIVLTWEPARIAQFLERHAYRAPMVGTPAVDPEGRPVPPLGPARFAIVPRTRRAAAARRALDLLGATQPLLWRRGAELPESRPDAVICLDLPSREDFSALSRLSQPLLFLSAAQVPYARTLASPLTPFPLPSEADLARDRAEELRARVAQAIEGGPLDGELALLGPLFERYDPAEVAAGVLAVSRQPAAGGPQPLAAPHLPVARQRVFVGVGKKDRASAKDLLGALLREAGLSKEEVGRIEVRETFSLVEVAAPAIERAIRGLSGATIRGRRVVARLDRGR